MSFSFLTIIYCSECKFERYAKILKDCFVQQLKDTKLEIQCLPTDIKGTFDVLLSSESDTKLSSTKTVTVHSKLANTNGFGLFSKKEHVELLIDLVKKHQGM